MTEALQYEEASESRLERDDQRQAFAALVAALPVTVVEPRAGWKTLNLREIWQFREVLYFLTWRDVKIRYKQSLLGIAWAIIQPLMLMVVFTIVFRKKADVASDGLPYPLFSFSGLVLWSFFATAISQAGNSVVASQALITKVYFPRLSIPFASVGAALFDFVVAFAVLVMMIAGYFFFFPNLVGDVAITPSLLLIIPIVLLTTLASAAVGTVLAALNVAYRDFKYTIPFLIQLWMFATPALYMGSDPSQVRGHPRHGAPQQLSGMLEAPINNGSLGVTHTMSPSAQGTETANPTASPMAKKSKVDSHAPKKENVVPDSIQSLIEQYNPMIGLVASFRAALLGQEIPWKNLAIATIMVMLAFFAACFYFHRVEDTFADII